MLKYITKTSKEGREYPVLLAEFKSGKVYHIPLPPALTRRIIALNNIPKYTPKEG